MRLWGKLMKNNKIIKDNAVPLNVEDDYQAALKESIIQLCDSFDIAKPYWLNKNLNEYNRLGKTSFNKDNFIEEITFDKLVIEELRDKKK